MGYFPNSTAGDYLEQQCERCPLGNEWCPVHGIQMLYNYDQLNKGNEQLREAMNLLIDADGNCQILPRLPMVAPARKGDPPRWLEDSA